MKSRIKTQPSQPNAEHAEHGDNGEKPAGESAELSELLDRIEQFHFRYIVFPNKHAAVVVALFVPHTWTFEAFDHTPYLHIHSPVKECGKTRLFRCLKFLCAKSWYTISPTEAVLFRKIDVASPTLLLDETDTVFSDKGDPNKEGVRAVLNAGYERGATVPRCQGPNHDLKDFRVFCPKAFAGIGNIPETIASRSVKIAMTRRRKSQPIEKFRRRDVAQNATPIVDALKTWSSGAKVMAALHAAQPVMPEGLGDRSEDICEPLLAIADMAGGDWPERARKALLHLRAKNPTDEDDIKIQLLYAIREILEEWIPHNISSKDLLKELVRREDEPWAAWWQKDIDNGNINGPGGKLAGLLRPFGIVSKAIREPGQPVAKGYPRTAFDEAFSCYLPPLPSFT